MINIQLEAAQTNQVSGLTSIFEFPLSKTVRAGLRLSPPDCRRTITTYNEFKVVSLRDTDMLKEL